MSASRGELLAEISRLRQELDDAQEENRQLREAVAPITAFPLEWQLTPLEGRALTGLVRGNGGVMTIERMLVFIYGLEIDVEEKIVDVLICKLRRKLSQFDISIKTKWGEGFYLDGPSLDLIRRATEAPSLALAA